MVKISFSEKLGNGDNAAFWCHLCPKLTHYPNFSAMCQKELPAELRAVLSCPGHLCRCCRCPSLPRAHSPLTHRQKRQLEWSICLLCSTVSLPPGHSAEHQPHQPGSHCPAELRKEKLWVWSLISVQCVSFWQSPKLKQWSHCKWGSTETGLHFLKTFFSLAWMGAAWKEILTSEWSSLKTSFYSKKKMEGVTVFFKRRGTWCVLYLNNFMTFEIPWLKPSFPHWFLYPTFEGCRREESTSRHPGTLCDMAALSESCSTYCLCCVHWSKCALIGARQSPTASLKPHCVRDNHLLKQKARSTHVQWLQDTELLEARSPAVPWRLQKSALDLQPLRGICGWVWHQKPQVYCSAVMP